MPWQLFSFAVLYKPRSSSTMDISISPFPCLRLYYDWIFPYDEFLKSRIEARCKQHYLFYLLHPRLNITTFYSNWVMLSISLFNVSRTPQTVGMTMMWNLPPKAPTQMRVTLLSTLWSKVLRLTRDSVPLSTTLSSSWVFPLAGFSSRTKVVF